MLVRAGQQGHTSDLAVGDADFSCSEKTIMSILPCRVRRFFSHLHQDQNISMISWLSSLELAAWSYDHTDTASKNFIVCCSHELLLNPMAVPTFCADLRESSRGGRVPGCSLTPQVSCTLPS